MRLPEHDLVDVAVVLAAAAGRLALFANHSVVARAAAIDTPRRVDLVAKPGPGLRRVLHLLDDSRLLATVLVQCRREHAVGR